MKYLFLCLLLTACTNGNVIGFKSTESINIARVSNCEGSSSKEYLHCIYKGRKLNFESKEMYFDKVVYHPTIFSQEGSDFCTELGLLCK